MTPADRTQHHSPTIRDRAAPGLGLVLMASGFVIMSLTDGVAKFLADNVPPGEVAWARFLFQSILAVPLVVAATGWRSLIPYRPAANALRGVLLSTATAMFFIGLKKIPLADSAAIFFILPFLLTILSVIVDRERVGWRRWTAITIGFSGALLVIQPSFDEFGLFALFPAGAAANLSIFMMLNRRLRGTGSAMALQAFAGLAGTATLTAMLFVGSLVGAPEFTIVAPTLAQWGLLAGMGAFAALGHYLMIVAFRYATPAVLAPTQYAQIVSATAFGYLVFGNFPDFGQWIGIAVVVACGVYVFWRETRVMSQR
jgi:drug/metabolite transporter (DMT)-like permease